MGLSVTDAAAVLKQVVTQHHLRTDDPETLRTQIRSSTAQKAKIDEALLAVEIMDRAGLLESVTMELESAKPKQTIVGQTKDPTLTSGQSLNEAARLLGRSGHGLARVRSAETEDPFVVQLVHAKQKIRQLNDSFDLVAIAHELTDLFLEAPSNDVRQTMNDITQVIAERIPQDAELREVVKQFNAGFFDELGFDRADRDPDKPVPVSAFKIHDVLQNRAGICTSLSLVYLEVARRLDLPVHGIYLPNHFLVRFDTADEQVNVETVQKGRLFSDRELRNGFGLNAGNGPYLESLTPRESLALHLHNLATHLFHNGATDRTIAALRLGLLLFPDGELLHGSLGEALLADGRAKEALSHCERSIELNPDYTDAYRYAAEACLELGQPDRAIEYYRGALRQKHDPALKLKLGELQISQGLFEDAKKILEGLFSPESSYLIGIICAHVGPEYRARKLLQEAAARGFEIPPEHQQLLEERQVDPAVIEKRFEELATDNLNLQLLPEHTGYTEQEIQQFAKANPDKYEIFSLSGMKCLWSLAREKQAKKARKEKANAFQAVAKTNLGTKQPDLSCVPMKSAYDNENAYSREVHSYLPWVHYFSDDDVAKAKVHFNKGKLHDLNGKPLSGRQLMFVVNEEGEFFLSEGDMNPDRIKTHSSILSGAPVACAGMMEVRNGDVVHMDRENDRYPVSDKHLEQARNQLRAMGVYLPSSRW